MPPPERFRPARADWIQACSVAAVLFALYALTSPRSVALEDDGLFVLSSYYLGIEHPPGYPLFTLIGHLFTHLPFGSVAYRVHLASALFGALTGAAAWLCARALIRGRLPAYLAAFGLGVSPVFWSQSIIAEVYTLNTFFFLGLMFLALQACPPTGQAPAGRDQRRLLCWMAFLFGLSLSNHWPLMLLVAPAFAVLLWPVREELLQRFGLLSWLVILGLLPYLWMVYRSWMALPISFDGPLETLPEIWFFLTRKGYAGIDQTVSANWLDRIKFFQFLGGQLFVQFAVAGTLLAAAGFAVQWRILGRKVAAFLTLAFLMPSAVLLLLLGFDYSSATKHVFHVYPLPAYAIGALWMGMGLAWLVDRYALRRAHAIAGGAAVLALILVLGSRANLLADHEWGARYAQAVLRTLPQNAVVFGQGEADLAPMAYFVMIENWRPDITLYHTKGLVLGNRLFHPLRTDEKTQNRILREMVDQQTGPVVFTLDAYSGYARRDRWLHNEVDKSSTDPNQVTVDIPEEAIRFFEESIAGANDSNAWIAYFQGELRRRYAILLAQSLPRGRPPDARSQRHVDLLGRDFFGALGIAEGLMMNKEGYSVGAVASALDKARDAMPSDVAKQNLSRFFYLRGAIRVNLRDIRGAIQDFETAVSVWPAPANAAIKPLEDLYRQTGDESALKALPGRVKGVKPLELLGPLGP
jgi:transmembrane protein TMEM260 (protein O-mannosyltransferase)